jgi:hypothetical protein
MIELVRGDDGVPIAGRWAPIVTPEQWRCTSVALSALL